MPMNGKMDVGYNVQVAVDAKHKMIAEFEVTNNPNDLNQMAPLMENVKEVLEVEEITAVTDAGYNSVRDIVNTLKSGVDVHVAGTDFDVCIEAEDGVGSEITKQESGRCLYLPDRNIVLCSMGKILYPHHYKKTESYGSFFNTKACKECTCKCTKESRGYRHRVSMTESDFSKDYNDKDLFIKQIRVKANKELVKLRKSIVEHPFGTVKRGMDAGYCLTKGKWKVRGEFSLVFLAYNFKRAINILGFKELMENIKLYAYC